MRIVVASLLVDDQEKALRFYTDVLGFKEKSNVPVGEYRWITVVSPQDPVTTVVLDDTSGNLIQIAQHARHGG